jgi:N-acylneuraminate cytidylyltransferase
VSNIAVILARGGSKGIPGKNIIPFCGKPLIAWSILQAQASASVDEVWVTSDSDGILAIAHSYGATPLVRPAEVATDTADTEDALLHMVDSWRAQKGMQPERIVLLEVTSPLRLVDDIDKALATFEREAADSLFSASLLHDARVWTNSDGDCRSVTYDYKNRSRRQDCQSLMLENGSIYIFRPEVLYAGRNRLGGKIAAYLMENWQSYNIDGDEDIEIVSWQFERHRLADQPQNREFEANKITLVVYDFDGVMTDNTVWVDQHGLEQVRVNRSDGLGVNAIEALGLKQLVLSAETHLVVGARAAKLNLPVSQGCADKALWLKVHCAEEGIPLERVLYVGNDVNDIGVMRLVGCAVCPADAHAEVRRIAHIVLARRGGEGIVQELAERIGNTRS